MYLFIGKVERLRERESLPFQNSFPRQVPGGTGPGQVKSRSLEFYPGLPHGWPGTQVLGQVSTVFPGPLAGI